MLREEVEFGMMVRLWGFEKGISRCKVRRLMSLINGRIGLIN